MSTVSNSMADYTDYEPSSDEELPSSSALPIGQIYASELRASQERESLLKKEVRTLEKSLAMMNVSKLNRSRWQSKHTNSPALSISNALLSKSQSVPNISPSGTTVINSAMSSVSNATTDEAAPFDVRFIAKLGKNWGVFHNMFMISSWFTEPRPTMTLTMLERYESDENAKVAAIIDIYNFVPAQLHEAMVNDTEFVTTFVEAVSAGRSSLIKRLRDHLHIFFPTLNNASNLLSSKAASLRAETTEFQRLLKTSITDKYYVSFAPILFPPGITSKAKCFWNPMLPYVLRLLILGPSSVVVDGQGSPSAIQCSQKSTSPFHNVRSVTPAAIAFTAILVRFTLSPDAEFNKDGKGATSKIDYRTDYYKYKKGLDLMLHTRPIQKLLAWWTSIVFGGSVELELPTHSAPLDDGDLDEYMAAINNASSNSESDSDGEPYATQSAAGPTIPVEAFVAASVTMPVATPVVAPAAVPNATPNIVSHHLPSLARSLSAPVASPVTLLETPTAVAAHSVSEANLIPNSQPLVKLQKARGRRPRDVPLDMIPQMVPEVAPTQMADVPAMLPAPIEKFHQTRSRAPDLASASNVPNTMQELDSKRRSSRVQEARVLPTNDATVTVPDLKSTGKPIKPRRKGKKV